MPSQPPEECAQCGASIPRGAKACPECGADERTGWREGSVYDGLDLPEGEEMPKVRPRDVHGLAWYWWAAAVAVTLLVGLALLGLR